MASDTGNAAGWKWTELYDNNKMTDYQAFRLFRDGVSIQNEYRIGLNWWVRNVWFYLLPRFIVINYNGYLDSAYTSQETGVRK